MRPTIRRECHEDDCGNKRSSEHNVRTMRATDSRFQRSDCLASDPMDPSTLRSAHNGAYAGHPTHHPCTFGGIEWGRGARGLSGKFWVRVPQRGCGTIGSLCEAKPRPQMGDQSHRTILGEGANEVSSPAFPAPRYSLNASLLGFITVPHQLKLGADPCGFS